MHPVQSIGYAAAYPAYPLNPPLNLYEMYNLYLEIHNAGGDKSYLCNYLHVCEKRLPLHGSSKNLIHDHSN